MTAEPLKKAHLSLRPSGQTNGTPYGTTTDNAGHFFLDDIDPGRYFLMATRNGFVTQGLSPQGGARQVTALDLAAGQKMKEVVLKLFPQGVITGHITDEDGDPIANVMVQCLRLGYPRGKKQLMPANGTSTNDLGEYRIHSLAPGRYYVSATDRSPEMFSGGVGERVTGSAQAQQAAEEGYATTYYPNTTQADSAAPIEINPGIQAQGIDLRLVRVRTIRIRGRIVNLPSDGFRNINIQLLPRDTSGMFVIRNSARVADKDGAFELRGVAPGSYLLMADHMEESRRLSARLPIDVGASNVDKIELTLAPTGEIAGRFVIEGDPNAATNDTASNSPNRPRVVTLLPKGPFGLMGGATAQVKDDLNFKLTNVGPNVYDVNVNLAEGSYLKSVRIGDQDVTDTGVDFTQGFPGGEMVVTISANSGQIDGTVQNAKNEPAIGTSVTLIPEASRRSLINLYKSATTDQNGHFAIKGIKPGEYKLFAWEEVESGAYMDPDFLKPHESAGEAVSIKENARETVQLKSIPATSPSAPRP